MVVLVNGAAYGAQGVVAVGEHIGQGELLHAGGPGGLDDAHIGDVVAGHGVKLQGELLHVIHGVMGLQDGVGHGALLGLIFGRNAAQAAGELLMVSLIYHSLAMEQVHAVFGQLDHKNFLLTQCFLWESGPLCDQNYNNGVVKNQIGVYNTKYRLDQCNSLLSIKICYVRREHGTGI